MNWTTPEAITRRVQRLWSRGDILAARIDGTRLFPYEIRLKRPTAREVADRFGDVLDWARELTEASRDVRGSGFELRRETVRSRVHGANALPVAAVIPAERDALELIRKCRSAERFRSLADETLERYPGLRDWLAQKPLLALQHAAAWSRILAVLDWFVAHPRPRLYPRQLDIEGVDTKFIEAHRKLLAALLDIVLPASAVDRSVRGGRGFNQRYGLLSEPTLVRFRLLDPAHYPNGLSDLSLPQDQFAGADFDVSRVFITENRTNGLAFPHCPGSMVVFGLGYGLERLSEVTWLRNVDVRYWGDIDTHGFGILNRLRATLPEAHSLLMDRETLDAHRKLWGREPPAARYTGDVARLTDEERALFDDLLFDRVGECVRLEQERIGYRWLERAIGSL